MRQTFDFDARIEIIELYAKVSGAKNLPTVGVLKFHIGVTPHLPMLSIIR